jgi:hypothetical protein
MMREGGGQEKDKDILDPCNRGVGQEGLRQSGGSFIADIIPIQTQTDSLG